MMKKSPFADIFKTMYIPQWRVAAAERKLKAFVSNGYEPVSFSPVGLSFFRVQFQCASPKDKDYYLYARFNAGGGPSLGFDSPCGKEERKIKDISEKTLFINSDLFAASLKPNADSIVVLNRRKEKLWSARKTYLSFLLFELSILPALFIVCYFVVPHEILFRETITVPPSLYPFAVFPIYAAIGTFALTKELKRLHNL